MCTRARLLLVYGQNEVINLLRRSSRRKEKIALHTIYYTHTHTHTYHDTARDERDNLLCLHTHNNDFSECVNIWQTQNKKGKL